VFLLSVRSAASVTLEGSVNAMSTKYEDNFGLYRIDDDNPEELEFFCHIRAQSEPTICATLQSESSIARAHQNM
jgi:hypothetical protein